MMKWHIYLFGILLSFYDNCEVFGRIENDVIFMLPDDCLSFSNCLAIATVTRINSSSSDFDFQPTSDASQTVSPTYAAIGLSLHTHIEDDSVVECVLSNNEIDIFLSYTKNALKGANRNEFNDEIRVTHRSYTDGVIHCVFEWQNHTALNNRIFDRKQLSYYLLPVVGNGENVEYSNRTPESVALAGSEILQESTDDIDYDQCGKARTCFGIPSGCLQLHNCHTAIAISYTSPTYVFQLMTSLGTRYVALALSDDILMADDSVIECVLENNIVNMYTSYSRVDYTGTDRHSANGVATLLNSSYVDGKINCYVERTNYNVINEREFDLDHQRFYILIAVGDDATDTQILEHKERDISSQDIYLQDIVSLIRADKPILIRLHGCFMVIAWMGTAAVGLVLARYYKSDWSGQQIFGKDIWFVGHMSCMVITWTLTLVAFILIFVHVGGWTRIGYYHGILGTIVTALCFFLPIGAIFRPSPDHKRRYNFNMGHYFIGRITFLLAIVTIFFAIFLNSAEIPYWFIAIMVLFSIFFWGNHILMGTMLYLTGDDRGIIPFLQSMIGPAKRTHGKKDNSAWYIRVKVKVFLVYSAVICAFVITGVLVILLDRK